jgi:hypothetical protein
MCLHAFGTRGAHPAPSTLYTRPAGARALSAPHLETTECNVVVPINDTDEICTANSYVAMMCFGRCCTTNDVIFFTP